MEQLIKKYGRANGMVLDLMKKRCDFNAEHNKFEWTGELKTHQIMEATGLSEKEVKDAVEYLLGVGFISKYKTFEVYSINILVINNH